MIILGSNSLGVLTVFIALGVFFYPFNIFFVNSFARVSKAQELMGQDLFLQIRQNLKLRNHVFQLINEYYPDNVADYLFAKYKLLQQVKLGNKQAEDRLEQEDIFRLKSYIDKSIANKIKNDLIR
jgi:hypothetical protein